MFTIQFREPIAPRYIFVNPENNQVHLLLPIVGGDAIGLDNTCQTVMALKIFFGKNAGAALEQQSALSELKRYQRALQFDISLIQADTPIKRLKTERLEQVQRYIAALQIMQSSPVLEALNAVFPDYPQPIKELISQNTNIYSMLLHPQNPDPWLRAVNPIFSVDRQGAQTFYRSLQLGYQVLQLGEPLAPRERLVQVVKGTQQGNAVDFAAIQTALTEQSQHLFGLIVDFHHDANGTVVSQADIEVALGGPSDDPDDYIESLIDCCARDLWDTIPSSPFTIKNTPAGKEMLSILTQFFLAEVNIQSYANGRTRANFGEILDRTPALSREVAEVVKRALSLGASVEQALFDFINVNHRTFGLAHPLEPGEMQHILQQFMAQYTTIKDSPHFDEFILFNSSKPGYGMGHQGAICIDLAEVICTPAFQNVAQPYFTHIRECARRMPVPRIASHKNEGIQGTFQIEEAELIGYLLNLIQHDNGYDTVIELLLSDTDNGQKVFQRLENAAIEALKSTRNWPALKIRAAAHITDPAIQLAFNTRFLSGDVQFTITNAMANSIYVAAVEVLGPDVCHDNPSVFELQTLLLNFLAREHVRSVELSAMNGFVLTLPQANVQAIQALIAANQDKIYLTPNMAGNIYREVTARFGEGSPEITAMNRLSNRGAVAHKLLEAFRLLGIQIDDPRRNISFPANGFQGYVIRTTPAIRQTIADIQQVQSRFHLTPAMAAALYHRVELMGAGDEIAQLRNDLTPDKIRHTLALLNIAQMHLSFNGENGYWVNISPQSERHIRDILEGRLPPPARNPIAGRGGRGSRGGARQDFIAAAVPAPLVARNPIAGRGGRGSRGGVRQDIIAAAAAAPIAAPVQQFTVQRVLAFRAPQALAANAALVQLNCPEQILQAFRQLLAGTAILGRSCVNPYTGVLETLPADAALLTARHLQILARNEELNTTGVMNVGLYNGALNIDQIGRLRCLVKATNVAGVVMATAKGGFGGSARVMFNPPVKTIIIDQSGLQWQGDLHNTGGLVFYPNNPQAPQLPAGYSAWQAEMYQAMYGRARPVAPSANVMVVRWLGVEGRICLNQLAMAIDSEFSQALEAAGVQGNVELAAGEGINFKFLKAGMGFFAAGLEGRNQVQLEHARLRGIEQALARIATLPEAARRILLGRIRRLELPFSGNVPGVAVLPPELAATLARIQAHVLTLGLEWGGTPREDALEPRAGLVNALTNCADPHAMIGNEGGQQSVDASIATNCELQHLNPAFNSAMQLRASPLLSAPMVMAPPIAAGVVMPAPAEAARRAPAEAARRAPEAVAMPPVAGAMGRFGLHAGEPVAANVLHGIDLLKHQIHALGRQLQQGVNPGAGVWHFLENICTNSHIPISEDLPLRIWEFGCSRHTGNICFASAWVQIELKPNGEIAIQDKMNRYAEIPPASREYLLALRQLSTCFPQLQQALEEALAANRAGPR